MARPRKSEHRDTKQAILDAALDLFAERGFFGTSMREIARAVGVRESALYHHFESKQAIFEVLLSQLGPGRVREVLSVDMAELAKAVGVKELLSRVVGLLVASWAIPQEQKFFRIVLQEGPRLASAGVVNPMQVMGRVRETLVKNLDRLVELGLIESVDTQAASLLLMGPLITLRVMHTAKNVPDFKALDADAQRLAAQLWRLLEPRAERNDAVKAKQNSRSAAKEG